MTQNPVPLWQVIKITAVFFLASVACCALLVFRLPLFGYTTMHYLVWNLFLAWIPFGLAVTAGCLWAVRPRAKWSLVLCGGAWLVFFPNAPYIITDIIHLRKMAPGPIWYDLMVTTAFAWTGFLLGFTSLYLMQRLVARIWGCGTGWLFVLATMGLSGFGIYLGRFIRLNSWNVVSAPVEVVSELATLVRHPFVNHGSLAFIFVTATFLFIAYVMVYAITHLERGAIGAGVLGATARKHPIE